MVLDDRAGLYAGHTAVFPAEPDLRQKEFQAGYANFLVKSGLAKVASEGNMKVHEEEKRIEAELEAKHLQDMKDLKAKIEAQPVKIIVKVAADGHVLGTVTTKNIAEAVEKQIGAKVDKRKITFTALATALGDYTAKVQLHKEVTATINILVVTK